MNELFDINAKAITEIGHDSKDDVYFIDLTVLRSGVPFTHRQSITEEEHKALCGWIQIVLSADKVTALRVLEVTQVILKSVSIRFAHYIEEARRLRECITATYVQQAQWETIIETKEGVGERKFWESRYGRFGFEQLTGGSFAYYTLERTVACPQVDTGYLPDIAEKLISIAESPLFPRVDYELQLRWRNGQTGLDGGYANVARVDKNAILGMGRLLGGKK